MPFHAALACRMKQRWTWLLTHCGLRHWRSAWRQQLALVAILALGSAVPLAVNLANQAAVGGMNAFNRAVTPGADFTLSPTEGSLKTEWLATMREALDPMPVELLPVMEERLTLATEAGQNPGRGMAPLLRLIGTDWLALAAMGNGRWLEGIDLKPASLQPELPQVMVSPESAWKLGDRIRLVRRGSIAELVVAWVAPKIPGQASMPAEMLLMDLPQAQRWLNRPADLDRVEVLVSKGRALPDATARAAAALRGIAQQRWEVRDPAQQKFAAASMTAAFRLNLTILSMLALWVGGYLIFQALDGLLLRRRNEIGILKSLGFSSADVQLSFLAEASVLGLIGGSLGLALGWFGAQAALDSIAATISALYGGMAREPLQWSLAAALQHLGLCLLTTLVAAWWPARQAAQSLAVGLMQTPSSVHQGGHFWQRPKLGLLLMLMACAVAPLGVLRTATGGQLPLGAYLAAVLWLLGLGLAASWLLPRCAGCFAALGFLPRLAASHLRRPSLRHRFALAALTSAIAMTGAMAIMVGSFEQTVRQWIERSLRADVFVASAGASGGVDSSDRLAAELVAKLRALPGLRHWSSLYLRQSQLMGQAIRLMGMDAEAQWRDGTMSWVSAPDQGQWWLAAAARNHQPALANETLSHRLGVKKGDLLTLPGGRQVQVMGVLADYGQELGSLWVNEGLYRQWFPEDLPWRAGLFLQPGQDAAQVALQLQEQYPGLSVFANAHLRREAMRIFHQTFAITHALEIIGLVVALAGLALSLTSLLMERRQQGLTLIQMGMRRGELVRCALWEAGGLALCGVVAGLLGALWLSWLLLERVNRVCFGWSLNLAMPWATLAALAIGVLACASLLALIVAARQPMLRCAMGLALLLPQLAAGQTATTADGFAIPQPGKVFAFPRDHGSHPEFRTEWWYITGHLFDQRGERHGFQFTLFRQASRQGDGSAAHLFLGHSALLHGPSSEFIHEERLRREGWDAQAASDQLRLRLGNWTLRGDPNQGGMTLRFSVLGDALLELELKAAKPLVVFGENGVSRKGQSASAASHYLTLPRLAVQGQLTRNGGTTRVHGEAWMDHEFSSSQLEAGQQGWDWASLQLKDGRDIMVYRMRREDGSTDPASQFNLIDAKGQKQALPASGFEWRVLQQWQSPHSGARYPLEVELRAQGELWRLRPLALDQEQRSRISGLAYWEGACDVLDSQGQLVGRAFLELAGYSGDLRRHIGAPAAPAPAPLAKPPQSP